jgi:hypothetical protein
LKNYQGGGQGLSCRGFADIPTNGNGGLGDGGGKKAKEGEEKCDLAHNL